MVGQARPGPPASCCAGGCPGSVPTSSAPPARLLGRASAPQALGRSPDGGPKLQELAKRCGRRGRAGAASRLVAPGLRALVKAVEDGIALHAPPALPAPALPAPPQPQQPQQPEVLAVAIEVAAGSEAVAVSADAGLLQQGAQGSAAGLEAAAAPADAVLLQQGAQDVSMAAAAASPQLQQDVGGEGGQVAPADGVAASGVDGGTAPVADGAVALTADGAAELAARQRQPPAAMEVEQA